MLKVTTKHTTYVTYRKNLKSLRESYICALNELGAQCLSFEVKGSLCEKQIFEWFEEEVKSRTQKCLLDLTEISSLSCSKAW
jgi:hypothetical protein